MSKSISLNNFVLAVFHQRVVGHRPNPVGEHRHFFGMSIDWPHRRGPCLARGEACVWYRQADPVFSVVLCLCSGALFFCGRHLPHLCSVPSTVVGGTRTLECVFCLCPAVARSLCVCPLCCTWLRARRCAWMPGKFDGPKKKTIEEGPWGWAYCRHVPQEQARSLQLCRSGLVAQSGGGKDNYTIRTEGGQKGVLRLVNAGRGDIHRVPMAIATSAGFQAFRLLPRYGARRR